MNLQKALFAVIVGTKVLAASGKPAAVGLSDPEKQAKFETEVPNALDPGFIFPTSSNPLYVDTCQTIQQTGLVDGSGNELDTTVWGYKSVGTNLCSWPGPTFQVESGVTQRVRWRNKLNGLVHPFTSLSGSSVVDTSLHWAYSLEGYDTYNIEDDGVPIVTHLHGGHSDFTADGNPEFFFSPGYVIRGPQWVSKVYQYQNDQPAGTLWYHDHALGLTRLNVYAGLAGFYIVRDDLDTGEPDNVLNLPTYPYEAALAIQDKMFKANGELFYPSFPGEPFYDDFITGEGIVLPDNQFPDGGPTALAEFFGDHMLVNGKIWPKMTVEPRKYRLRLLNGCDSRFLVVKFFKAKKLKDEDVNPSVQPLPFTVVGTDQGLVFDSPVEYVTSLLMETGSRYDIVLDFSTLAEKRVIMKNFGGDEPFGGDIPGPGVFRSTDRIMAFDVTLPFDDSRDEVGDFPDTWPGTERIPDAPTRTRKVALFEGRDEYGRLQPLLGTAEPATDYQDIDINWPNTEPYIMEDLIGPVEGTVAWHTTPATENPALDATEVWEIYNLSADAHPIHLHLVHFEILERRALVIDSEADEDGIIADPGTVPADDGVFLSPQSVVQHNGEVGEGFKVVFPSGFLVSGLATVDLGPADGYIESGPKDVVTALPGQVTIIKATFDKPGRYVWHCHILSHEDHEMMRVLHVGPEP